MVLYIVWMAQLKSVSCDCKSGCMRMYNDGSRDAGLSPGWKLGRVQVTIDATVILQIPARCNLLDESRCRHNASSY